MKNIKVGIVGVGNIGFAHADSIYNNHIIGAKLSALCDINSAVADTCSQKFSNIPFYFDYDEFLSKADIDTVIVSVPHPLHADMAVKAIKSGKNVLVEKPIDITVSKAKLLNETAKASGKKFGVMFNQRTGELFKKAREIVKSGALGELKRSSWIITNWYRTQYYYDSGDWRATWSGEGGGVLVNQAPHQLDLWQWICGMPTQITAFCDTAKYHNIEVEDSATIYARFENGADGVFIASTGEYPGSNRLDISGTKGKIVLENGKLKWWRLKTDEREYCKTEKRASGEIEFDYQEFLQSEENGGHRIILQNFANSVLNGEELIAPGYEAINELTLQNAAYLSEWTGNKEIKIPFDNAKFDEILAKKQEQSIFKKSHTENVQSDGYNPRWQIKW